MRANGFLGGYNGIVWLLVAVQAGGGLLVAAVVKYTDNILKAFATSAALVAVSVASVFYFNFPASPLFVIGAATVLYSMFLYGDLVPPRLVPPGLALCERACTRDGIRRVLSASPLHGDDDGATRSLLGMPVEKSQSDRTPPKNDLEGGKPV